MVVTPAISDLALTGTGGIRGFDQSLSFDPANFPEPFLLSGGGQLKVGDEVKILGLHPHPEKLQANKVLVGIMRGYYDMFWEKEEFVFDELPATVINLAKEVKNKDIQGSPSGFEFISNTYIEIRTTEDHQFSFGGLSGGPVRNKEGEVIGVVTAGIEGGHIVEGFEIVYKPWNTLYITPVEELNNLMTLLLQEDK